MKLLVAPDSFKGSLTSKEACEAITEGAKAVDEQIEIIQFPSSDGGEGFCYCMKNIYGGEVIKLKATNPLGDIIDCEYVFNKDISTAFIEMASCSGLSLVSPEKRNIMKSNTYGLGELIRDAIKIGAKTIIIGLGGSATNDCGIGMLSALGVVFYDKNGNELSPLPINLHKVAFADKSNMMDLSSIELIAACDVKNSLCGEMGAANVFARQKGATDDEIVFLDNGAESFSKALKSDCNLEGCGAAGGVGFALVSYLGAKYVSGAKLLVDSPKFQEALKDADCLITGEGNTDKQTAYGKFISVIANKCKENNLPVVVISGGLSDGYEELYAQGVTKFYCLSEYGRDLEYCINNAYNLLITTSLKAVKKLL